MKGALGCGGRVGIGTVIPLILETYGICVHGEWWGWGSVSRWGICFYIGICECMLNWA